MNTDEKKTVSLDDITVDRTIIEELYAQQLLTPEARKLALEQISPPLNWGLWTARILLALGTTLILSGIIFFFAYNWHRIGDFAKLGGIQLAIIACVGAACFLPLSKLPAKLLMLSASVLVGVFMAVFGQIYQTGADAWQLFFYWLILTFGWTLLSSFPAQWIFSLIIAHLFLMTWWKQEIRPTTDLDGLNYIMFISLYGTTLIAFELGKAKKMEWLDNFWLRPLLSITLLCFATWSIVIKLLENSKSHSLTIAAGVGAICIALMFLVYRYRLKDIKSLSLTVMAICIIAVTTIGKAVYQSGDEIGATFIMGVITLAVFAGAITYIRKISKQLEA